MNRKTGCTVCKDKLTATIYSPDGDPTHIPSNSTVEGEGITRTGGRSCSELSCNITCRETGPKLLYADLRVLHATLLLL